MILFPNCKINLGLHVLRRRPDCYHDLETLMLPVGLTDILELVPSASGSTTLAVTGRAVACPPEKNLVMKAFRAVEKEVGTLPPTDIFLHKIIPDGAGLGGGSSDAAFAITGLNTLWNLGLSEQRMLSIAASVGADCPFFIYNKPAMAVGTGTTLIPAASPLPEGSLLLLAKPEAGVSTAQAYSCIKPDDSRAPLSQILSRDDWAKNVVNDFEASVIPQVPEIGDIKKILESTNPIYCAMSGSGSALFAVYRPSQEAPARRPLATLGTHAIGIFKLL